MRFIVRQGRALLLAALLVAGAVCVSNGDNPSNLVGQWVNMNTGEKIELFKDGTGVVGSKDLTWKTEGKRFMLSSGGSSSIRDYKLSGYELTRTDDDGDVILWVRKDNVEDYKKKNTGYFTDSRNGQKYRTVKIDGKTWMAENLNYQTGNSWCYANNNSNCEKYGRLYDWNTAKTACPSGWHLPSDEEWGNLVTAVGGRDVAGKRLKSTSGWEGNGNGVDVQGFSALPGGYRDPDGAFYYVGTGGGWWSASEGGSDIAYYRGMIYNYDRVNEVNGDKGYGFSVRCRQDERQ